MKGIPDPSGLLCIRTPVPFFRYPSLSSYPELEHAIFTRHGGTSNPPHDSLNTSYEVGDLAHHVDANLTLIKDTLGADHLMYMKQTHGNRIHSVRTGNISHEGTPLADAVITDRPGLAILVKQADCQGVTLFDPRKSVVANVHCGWRGNVENILGKVVARMENDFGCRGYDLLAGIGPSLGPCCAEFVGHERLFPKYFEECMVNTNYFNLQEISCRQLLVAGLRKENIEVSGICTRCRTDLFYSYRGEGTTGRFGTVVMLR